MKLLEKFQQIQKHMSNEIPEDILNTFAQSLRQLIEQNPQALALKEGDIAPDFTLPAVNGEPVSLYDELKKSAVVLSFFRGNWCPFCMAELAHYQEAINNGVIDGAKIIAVSPQKTAFNEAITQKSNLQFKVLSDQGNNVAEKYGLVFTLQEEVHDIYKKLGADLAVFNGDTTYELPIPATYIIGQDKKIRFASVDTNYMERADILDISSKI